MCEDGRSKHHIDRRANTIGVNPFPDLPTSNILGLAVAGGKTNLDLVSARTHFLPTFPCRLRYMHAAAPRIHQAHRKATTARAPPGSFSLAHVGQIERTGLP
ncbi:hypothetical protein FOCG_18176 [Fusarium oxysporum f. sp. radicis-lycopersici 26381]|nr:hypothetical protein FOCG_18176 [Fusarium oxysporum f. sp. radicis-lycopersici 26381]